HRQHPINCPQKPDRWIEGEQSWVVLADPEGNEFCILESKNPPHVKVDAPGIAPFELTGRTLTGHVGGSVRGVALSIPFVETTAVALYLLVTLWRIGIGEAWLFPWQNMILSAAPAFAVFAAIVVIAITALVYRRLSAARASSGGGFDIADVNRRNGGVPAKVLASRTTNALAIASLIIALIGIGPVAVIVGHLANSQIKTSGERGSGIAAVGLVLGYLELAFLFVAFLYQWRLA
ncbi:MAG: DUF4190 domain-containing protein, partial [Cellulomonas sp.]